jgi:hypothetical protein
LSRANGHPEASGADTYEWQTAQQPDGVGGQPRGHRANPHVKPAATTLYKVTGYKGQGCSDTKSVLVIVEQVDIPLSTWIVCESLPGEPPQVENLYATGAFTYTWSWTDPFTNAKRTATGETLAVSQDDLSPGEPTKYVVTGVNKAGNCASRDSVLVSRVPSDYIRVATPRIRICKGQTAQIQAFGATNDEYYYSATGSNGDSGWGSFRVPSRCRRRGQPPYYIQSAFVCTNEEPVVVEVDAVDAGTDISVCQGDPVQLGATYTSGKGITDCRNPRYYDQELIEWNPETPASGQAVPVTTLNRATRRISTALNIGFPFRFYCNTYTSFYISSSGFLTFDAGNTGTSPQPITTSTRHNLVALAWADLDPTQGTISYFTTGTAPNRRLVVTLDNVPMINSPFVFSSQAILHETTNEIEIHITRISFGAMHAVGIKGAWAPPACPCRAAT